MHHQLPPLPWAPDALEPFVDSRTVLLHHDEHHATYVNKLNKALAQAPDLQQHSVLWLLRNLDKVPEKIRTEVRNNGGGHVNHALYWRLMSPRGGTKPQGRFAAAIDQSFGSFERFKTAFEEAGAKVFGSGWVWLVSAPGQAGALKIMTTPGHDHPLMQDLYPILVNDVWEHAYYLKHQNRRPEFLKTWWSVTNWGEAQRRFERAESMTSAVDHDEEFAEEMEEA